ncbi:class A beta-lactamase [Roseomonas marmotae]|uniref:Beta-lactamase n=1 Tax=Roseomonas marmotae TaxID=2768161 RepID=A0ABS3K6Y9_9PROT|nr:class A beta-lactamase [Roseomonas marmotae]MBO1073208.1 class A beta-lactamase [Roseomonas marmotae]QTI79162.1 class A beta-lactamase [Roseomonas marmotae]
MIGRRQWMGGAALALGGWGMGAGLARAGAREDFGALPEAFARIEAAHGGRLGVAVLDTGSGRRAGHRQDERFPMTSTFKMLAAGAVLARVDAGQERLERRIRFAREDLVTYSPATEKHAGRDGMTLAEIAGAAVTLSDNTAGNLLLDVLGGPAGLTAWARGQGDEVTRLDRMETALNEGRPGDARDTTSPAAMLGHLQGLTLGQGLSDSSRALLRGWMRASRTGDACLKARLPQGWLVEDKTGSGGHGTRNDVGLLWPPGGGAPVLVAAYLTSSPADAATRDATLADVGAVVVAAWKG